MTEMLSGAIALLLMGCEQPRQSEPSTVGQRANVDHVEAGPSGPHSRAPGTAVPEGPRGLQAHPARKPAGSALLNFRVTPCVARSIAKKASASLMHSLLARPEPSRIPTRHLWSIDNREEAVQPKCCWYAAGGKSTADQKLRRSRSRFAAAA
jgi:hypothetical protein